MELVNLSHAVVVLLVGACAPKASYMALRQFPDSRVDDILGNAVTLGVMDLYLQLSTVITTSLVLIMLSVFALSMGVEGGVRVFTWTVFGLPSVLIVWVFLLGGAARIPVDPYMRGRPFQLGEFQAPPWKSWLTWVRYVLVVLGVVFSFATPR